MSKKDHVATLKILIEMYERDLDILKNELRLREEGTTASKTAGVERVLRDIDDVKHRLQAYVALVGE
ncbi:MAG: hypothetical protein WBV18_08585 [Methyloceanibacter sp.]|jgi:hypothetical protein|uniref:hypothetical protein n=1 Tax=Methyloceanibacter sp. TaxID=1965321 RepID=UPI003C65EE29